MNKKFVISDEAIAETITELENLMLEVDDIQVKESRTEGGEGRVYDSIVEGENDMEELKEELKALIGTTVTFIKEINKMSINTDVTWKVAVQEERG